MLANRGEDGTFWVFSEAAEKPRQFQLAA
jgi:hypothetical protein